MAKTNTVEQAMNKAYGKCAPTHITGYEWAKKNNLHTKSIPTLTDEDYDKMEAAVKNGEIQMVCYEYIAAGAYAAFTKFDK